MPPQAMRPKLLSRDGCRPPPTREQYLSFSRWVLRTIEEEPRDIDLVVRPNGGAVLKTEVLPDVGLLVTYDVYEPRKIVAVLDVFRY